MGNRPARGQGEDCMWASEESDAQIHSLAARKLWARYKSAWESIEYCGADYFPVDTGERE